MIEEWPEWATKIVEEHDAKVASGEIELRTSSLKKSYLAIYIVNRSIDMEK